MILTIAIIMIGFISPQLAHAHCQIPCGIFDDHARIKLMLEDAATIEKSMKLIGELSSKTDAQSINQKVRWVIE